VHNYKQIALPPNANARTVKSKPVSEESTKFSIIMFLNDFDRLLSRCNGA